LKSFLQKIFFQKITNVSEKRINWVSAHIPKRERLRMSEINRTDENFRATIK